MSVSENIYHPRVVTLYCPKCKEQREVQANMIHMDFVKTSVLQFPDHCEIDWENADIEGDFEYICEMCGTKLADSLEDMENKLKEEEDGGSELQRDLE